MCCHTLLEFMDHLDCFFLRLVNIPIIGMSMNVSEELHR